jgi:nitrite reductase/ring-hydroxylating ferredoxin subunit
MSIGDRLRQHWPKDAPVGIIPRIRWAHQRPTYRDAQPGIIEAALDRSAHRPTGNWYVFAASRDVRTGRAYGTRIADLELVAWRDRNHRLRIGPARCPHLSADLATGVVSDGVLYCRWHGLAFDGENCDMRWKPLPCHDDGVLAWVRLDAVGGEPPTDAPVAAARPDGETLAAVLRVTGSCEPSDIIANRLDPWHGAWFHPYSFTRLDVLSTPTEDDDRFLVEVTFRMSRFGVPVIAEFTTPEARTVVMRIVEGEGTGSVVETHATPIGLGPDGLPRVAVIEATIASSSRPGFSTARRAGPLIAPIMRYAATRLWRDDLAYAERRYRVRTGELAAKKDERS